MINESTIESIYRKYITMIFYLFIHEHYVTTDPKLMCLQISE